jgi:integrase
MSTRNALAAWDVAVTTYLANRRALGRTYRNEEYTLNRVRRFLVKSGATDLDEGLFDRWRAPFYRLSNRTRIIRERAVYNFCRYRRRSEPQCFLPDPGSFARPKPLPLPRIIEREQVIRLLRYVSALMPTAREPLRPAVLRVAILLLYTTGIRRGELVRLTLGDVDVRHGVLFIRDSKFHKSRWVPVSSSVHSELRSYLDARRRAGFDSRSNALATGPDGGDPAGRRRSRRRVPVHQCPRATDDAFRCALPSAEVRRRRIALRDDAAREAYPPALRTAQHGSRAAQGGGGFCDDQPVVGAREPQYDDALLRIVSCYVQ